MEVERVDAIPPGGRGPRQPEWVKVVNAARPGTWRMECDNRQQANSRSYYLRNLGFTATSRSLNGKYFIYWEIPDT